MVQYPHAILRMILTTDEMVDNDRLNSAITSSTADPATWSMIKGWLTKCLETHDLCHAAENGFVPTRLLRTDITNGERTFRLIETRDSGLEDEYVALSHCWGTEPAKEDIQLSASTQEILRKGGPIAKLPRTFREAFVIIERLGIRYLWIDSLCIFQDSEADWQTEAARMQTVYRNGFLTIAALGARDNDDGCFFLRNPRTVAPTVINLRRQYDGNSLPYRFDEEKNTVIGSFVNEPLLKRAWVLQERLLSARVLYFGREQVFWECCETNCCETQPNATVVDEWPSKTQSHDGLPDSRRDVFKLTIDGPARQLFDDPLAELFSMWGTMVRKYTSCDLTKSKDKLVALSGLAKHMARSLREVEPKAALYLAGLWETTMPGSLLWRPKEPAIRPEQYRAPSWSWASLDGEIITAPGYGVAAPVYASLVRRQVISKGTDETGEIIEGTLTLRGFICQAKVAFRVKKSLIQAIRPEIAAFCDPHNGRSIKIKYSESEITFDTHGDGSNEVFIFPVTSYAIGNSPSPIVEIKALVLAHSGLRASCYRRIGIARIRLGTNDTDNSDPVSIVLQQLCRETIQLA
jgi:hypothetical protein